MLKVTAPVEETKSKLKTCLLSIVWEIDAWLTGQTLTFYPGTVLLTLAVIETKVGWLTQHRSLLTVRAVVTFTTTAETKSPIQIKFKMSLTEKIGFSTKSLVSFLFLNTRKLACKDHPRDQKNVVLIHRWSFYEGSITWKVYPWGATYKMWSLQVGIFLYTGGL